jgi:hypothetical protein
MAAARWAGMATAEREPAALPRSPAGFDPAAASARVPGRPTQRPGRQKHSRGRLPARGWGRPRRRRGSAVRGRVRFAWAPLRRPRAPVHPARGRYLAALEHGRPALRPVRSAPGRGPAVRKPRQAPRQAPPAPRPGLRAPLRALPRRPGPAAPPRASPERHRDRLVLRRHQRVQRPRRPAPGLAAAALWWVRPLVPPAPRAPSSPRRGSRAPPRGPPALRRGSAAPGRRPSAPRRVRRRLWRPGHEACPAHRPSDPRPGRRDRLACPLTPRPPRLRRRRSRGRQGRPPGGRAVAGPWAGELGERQGPWVHAVPVVASHRRGAARAGRPWERTPQTSGRQERRGARDDAAGARQDRPGRAAHRGGPAVRRSDGLPTAKGSMLPELEARWLEPAPAGPWRPAPVGPRGPAPAGPVLSTPVWPRQAMWASPRPTAPARPRATAPVSPRRVGPAWPRQVGWGEASGVVRDTLWARPGPFGTRWVGLANPEAGRGVGGLPRVGWVLVRTPGWTPIGRRREALGPAPRVGDLRGGR